MGQEALWHARGGNHMEVLPKETNWQTSVVWQN